MRSRVTNLNAAVEKAPEPVEKKTWVAIELVDDDGKPVPWAKYRIELPDYSVREGILDVGGKARLDGIVDGECKISFPSFHKDDRLERAAVARIPTRAGGRDAKDDDDLPVEFDPSRTSCAAWSAVMCAENPLSPPL